MDGMWSGSDSSNNGGGRDQGQQSDLWNAIANEPHMSPFLQMTQTGDGVFTGRAGVPNGGGVAASSSSSSSSANSGGALVDSVGVAKTEAKGNKKAAKAGKTATATKAAKKATANRTGLSEQEKIARREKHNQVEIRRRKRINQRFNELGDICGCDSKQKRNILTSAIDKLKEYEERIQQLKQSLEQLSVDGDGGADAQEDGKTEDTFQTDHSIVDHRSVFMKSGVPLHVSGFDGRILDCNDKFAQLFGHSRELILANGVTVFSLTAPESLAVTFGVVGHLMKGNPRAQVDNIMIGPGGRLIKVKVTAWLIRDNGRPKYFMSMMVPDPNYQPPPVNVQLSQVSNVNVPAQPSSLVSFGPNSSQGSASQQQFFQQAALGMGMPLPMTGQLSRGMAGPESSGMNFPQPNVLAAQQQSQGGPSISGGQLPFQPQYSLQQYMSQQQPSAQSQPLSQAPAHSQSPPQSAPQQPSSSRK